jgi:hypothetical protein
MNIIDVYKVQKGGFTLTALSDQRVLERILELTLDHMVAYRLEIGRIILDEFFEGDPAAFHDRSPTKPVRFQDFVKTYREKLSDIGLGEQVLRQSVRAHLVVEELGADRARPLTFSHLLTLARVKDGGTRRLLADASARDAWSVAQLEAAAERVEAGQWPDQDLTKPGLQPEPIKPTKPRPPRPTTAKAITSKKEQGREVKKVRSELKRTEKALNTVVAGLKALKAGGWQAGEKGEELRGLIAEVRRRLEEIGAGVG